MRFIIYVECYYVEIIKKNELPFFKYILYKHGFYVSKENYFVASLI